MSRFSLRQPYAPGEPAHGHLLRLSARYAVEPATLGSRWGFDIGDLVRGRGVLAFAAAAQADGDRMVATSPIVNTRARRVALGGEELMLGDWSLKVRRWCPMCFAVDAARGPFAPFQRNWWDVSSIGTCPVHLVLMLDSCPRCQSPTTWSEPRLARCACGQALAEADATPIPRSDAAAARYLAGRLGAVAREPAASADGISLAHLPGFIERLGAALCAGWSEHRPLRSGAERQSDMSAGLACLKNTFTGLGGALDIVAADRMGRPAGLCGAYGWIYTRWLSFAEQDRTGGALIAVLREHAVANRIITADEPVLGHAPGGGLSITALSGRLKVGYEKARRIVVSSDLVDGPLRRGVAARVRAADVAAVAVSLAGRIDGSKAASMLGVGRHVVYDLRDAGLVACDGYGTYFVDDIRTLPSRLARGVADRDDLVPLTSMAKSGAASVASLCAAIDANELSGRPLTSRPARLSEIGLVAADVRARWPGTALTVRGLAAQLRIHEDAVRQISALGMLSDNHAAAPTVNGLILFQRDFVTAGELGRRFGVSTRRARIWLDDLGVDRALGPPMCRQIFYKRAEAETTIALASGEGLGSIEPAIYAGRH